MSPKTLTTNEAIRFINHFNTEEGNRRATDKAIRDKLMVLLMLDAGLRVGELVQLLITDLYVLHEPVTALRLTAGITKTKTERTIPLTARVREGIQRVHARDWRNSNPNGREWAFITGVAGKHITVRQVQRIVNQAALVTLGHKIHPHILRHTFASRLMRTTNVRIVQELLGHKQVTTTQIYTHPNGDDFKKAIDSLE